MCRDVWQVMSGLLEIQDYTTSSSESESSDRAKKKKKKRKKRKDADKANASRAKKAKLPSADALLKGAGTTKHSIGASARTLEVQKKMEAEGYEAKSVSSPSTENTRGTRERLEELKMMALEFEQAYLKEDVKSELRRLGMEEEDPRDEEADPDCEEVPARNETAQQEQERWGDAWAALQESNTRRFKDRFAA
eukprot:g54357.t1